MKFKENKRGFYDVRRMPALIDLLENHAEHVARKANAALEGAEEHFGAGSRQGRKGPSPTGGPGFQGRWRASVFTKDQYAKRHNAEHNTLLKALHG
jgi:hypothetical protein